MRLQEYGAFDEYTIDIAILKRHAAIRDLEGRRDPLHEGVFGLNHGHPGDLLKLR